MKTLILILSLTGILLAQTGFTEIDNLIASGNHKEAKTLIQKKIVEDDLTPAERYDLNFKIEKMERIESDFKRTKEDIYSRLAKYYPDLNDDMIAGWEKDKSLEMKIINGEKKYFNNAVPNLFRVNKEAKEKKLAAEGGTYHNKLNKFLSTHLPQSINNISSYGKKTGNPVTMKLKFTLTVDKDAVPDGEIIRCWLPYPKENHSRQTAIKLLSVNSEEYIIASNENLQRTLYLEKAAKAGEPTIFRMELQYTAFSEWHNINEDNIKPFNVNSELYKEYTKERSQHIVFTDKIKSLSEKIIGSEKNPYKKVKLIYEWINSNIPWASAREYSTLDNIPEYCISQMHGDCGIKSLLFITLSRYNGIPAKWQSGWMMHPGSLNLHDWSEIYLEDYGWVPVDPDFGIQDSDDERVKYFFTNGIDSYRYIVNDDFSQPLFPSKIYPRSETVDFQRGEVEWRGGNLYFDKWDYNMKVEYFPGDK